MYVGVKGNKGVLLHDVAVSSRDDVAVSSRGSRPLRHEALSYALPFLTSSLRFSVSIVRSCMDP